MITPKMVKVRQEFPKNQIPDVQEYLQKELEQHLSQVKSGSSIAITVGSRGITNRVLIVKTIVEYLQNKGAKPFVIGAMGSHGGGTPEGQMDVLNSLGFLEETVGCPVFTSSEVVEVGKTPSGFTVYCDRYAWESDGIIVLNRIKLHTAFRGPNESGLLKMITVGLGKAKGAKQLHKQGPSKMSETVREVGGTFLKTGKVLAGIGIVENGYDQTAHLNVIAPDNIIEKEQELLLLSKKYFPRLPVEQLDLLVIKNMGKNFSGTGMDTNVIGRNKIFGTPEPENPKISRITVLDLDDSSHGNATGVGLADFTTEKLFQKIDREKTYLNCITSTYVQRAMIPIVMDNDEKSIGAAISSLAADDPLKLRIAIIDNTLELEEMYLSESVLLDLGGKVSINSEPTYLSFDEKGELTLK